VDISKHNVTPTLPKAMDYLTSREIQAQYRLSIAYLSQMRTRGEGPRYARLGSRKVIYLRADVERWIIAHSIDPRCVG
jgi:predicted DNA-binding transcriptional regulator AlpA